MTRQAVKRQMKGTSEAARLRLAAVAAEYVESLGRGLRFRREELGLSRSEVARKLPGKTNENAIYRWEGGQHKPNDSTLEALATVLEVGHWTRFMDLDPHRVDSQPAETPSPFPAQETSPGDLRGRLDAIEQAQHRIIDNQERIFGMFEAAKQVRDDNDQTIAERLNELQATIAKAISQSAAKETGKIVDGIVAKVAAGELSVAPPASSAKAPKRAPKDSQAA